MGFLKNLLGLGVAAGTAYAAVKVAQKYNEKKNANADLNGDGAVDANDTVYGVKEAAREVYAETAAKVREKAPEVREKAAAAIGAVQEKAPEFIEKVKGAASEAWSAIHGENFPAAEVELEEEPTCSEDVTAEETEEPAEGTSKKNKVVNIHATTQLKVVLVKPERFEDASTIADHLNNKRTVVLNLESTNKEVSRRLVDFLSGVAYANNGQIKRVANSTFIITPYNVDIMGDLLDELENNGAFY